MLTCINKKSPEYQTLKNKSGIPDSLLKAICRDYLDKYGRFPYLDELPESNSEPHLKDRFKIQKNNGADIDIILGETNTSTVEEANRAINNEYRDLEVEITPISSKAIVDITHRPSLNNFDVHPVEVDASVNSKVVFNNLTSKLTNLYGININTITDAELTTPEWSKVAPHVSMASAFVYNNEIYVNVDKSSVDAPVHELMHILVGSMHFTNPTLYQGLVDSVQNFPNYNLLAQNYPGRSRNDINEEIFITETAKHVMGLPSNLDQADKKVLHELYYNVKRVLDTVLMGQDSVRTITDNQLYNYTLKELTQEVNSSIMTNQFSGTLNVEGSELHRKLNNMKSDLIKNKQLEEYCE